MLFLLISSLNSKQLSLKIVQREKYTENVLMKTLNQYRANSYTFKFHGFCIAAAQIEILH